ncbi:hypothetical protein J1N35_041654 [Gossypium stocksii]|uniref:MPBQ/MBSQ family SAM-binding methyltransferase profile domain-containing protein n=1 Tax=Gossypium stocksii TaxID=47602 RepID=A0A9D3ZJL9_9ROSI|nr:hypothetical protein J1N35_041654 [Gossypium stocksii]
MNADHASLGRQTECRIIESDAEDLPFRTDYADRYVSASSIEYWPDPQRGIKEAYKEFYNSDLLNCEHTFNKMGRSARVNIICGKCLNGQCKDMWAVGAILAELFTSSLNFPSERPSKW